jgi:hypothetical protein
MAGMGHAVADELAMTTGDDRATTAPTGVSATTLSENGVAEEQARQRHRHRRHQSVRDFHERLLVVEHPATRGSSSRH